MLRKPILNLEETEDYDPWKVFITQPVRHISLTVQVTLFPY